MLRRYLDHNASSPVLPEVARTVADALVSGAENPSSAHAEGRHGRDALEAARRGIAAAVGAEAADLVLTSGGTEAASLGLVGLALGARQRGAPARVLYAATEHPCVLAAAAATESLGFTSVGLPVDAAGRLQLDTLERELAAGAAVCAASVANHEVGTRLEADAVALLAASEVPWLADAAQALGKIELQCAALGAEAVCFSAHKIGGPRGCGALWLAPGAAFEPLFSGTQESGRRPGTESVALAAGFAAAAAHLDARLASQAALAPLRDRLEAAISALPGARIHGAGAVRLANTTSFAIAGLPGELVVAALDLAGIAVSTGAACSSGTSRPSTVLRALGFDATGAREGVRVSTGPATTADDIDALAAALPPIAARARAAKR